MFARTLKRITLGKGACSRPTMTSLNSAWERITLGKGACSRRRTCLDVELKQRITLGKGACSRPKHTCVGSLR